MEWEFLLLFSMFLFIAIGKWKDTYRVLSFLSKMPFPTMLGTLSDDPSDEENIVYLIATGKLPSMKETNRCTCTADSHPGKAENIKWELNDALKKTTRVLIFFHFPMKQVIFRKAYSLYQRMSSTTSPLLCVEKDR